MEASKKLPAFYLMDSINKNLPESTNYKKLFAQNIVSVFVAVFEKVAFGLAIVVSCYILFSIVALVNSPLIISIVGR